MSVQPFTRPWFENYVREFFDAVDKMDTPGTMSFLSRDPICQFGNNLGYAGREEISKLFFDWYWLYDYLYHNNQTLDIDLENRVIYYGSMVSYIVKGDRDRTTIDVPAMSVLRFSPAGSEEETKVNDFRVYFNPSVLFEKINEVNAYPVESVAVVDAEVLKIRPDDKAEMVQEATSIHVEGNLA